MKSCIKCGQLKLLEAFYSGLNTCRECKIEQVKSWCSDNKEKCNGYRKKYIENNPEENRAAKQKWADNNRPKISNKRLKHSFGITLSDYEAILDAQNYRCAICGTTECATGKNFAVDHNHTTGQVRGLLCKKCNTGLGLFGDSPETIEAAYGYLIQRGHYGREAT